MIAPIADPLGALPVLVERQSLSASLQLRSGPDLKSRRVCRKQGKYRDTEEEFHHRSLISGAPALQAAETYFCQRHGSIWCLVLRRNRQGAVCREHLAELLERPA